MRKVCILFTILCILICCSMPAQADETAQNDIILNLAGDSADIFEIPLDFTLRENQSQNVDVTVYMQYCFMTMTYFTQGMTTAELEALMSQKRLYYAERTQHTDQEQRVITSYRFLPTLLLEFYGDPIETAQLVVTCAQHPKAYLTLPLSTLYTFGNEKAQTVSYEDLMHAQYPRNWNGDLVAQTNDAEWADTYNLAECLGKDHESPAEAYLLEMAALGTLGCPCMSPEAVQSALEAALPANTASHTFTEWSDSSELSLSKNGLFGNAELSLDFLFSNKKLTQVRLTMFPPMCSDMFSSPLAYDESQRKPDVMYHLSILGSAMFVDLNATWGSSHYGIE